MLIVLKKLLLQLIEFNRSHPSRLFELLHGIYSKIGVFDRIIFSCHWKIAPSSFMVHLLREQMKTLQNVRRGEFTL